MNYFDNFAYYQSVLENVARLPELTKDQARLAYKQFKTNLYQGNLQFKKLSGRENAYSVRVGLHYRALGLLKGDTIYWFGSELMQSTTILYKRMPNL